MIQANQEFEKSEPISGAKKGLAPGFLKKKPSVIIGTLNIFIGPIKKRHERHYKKNKLHLGLDLMMLIIIFSLVFSLIWIKASNKEYGILLEMEDLPQAMQSGDEAVFTLKYINSGNKKIIDSSLAAVLPDYFLLIQAEPAEIFDPAKNTFNIGDLEVGSNGIAQIKGRITGEVGAFQEAIFVFSYQEDGQERNLSAYQRYYIEDSQYEIKIEQAEEIYLNSKSRGMINIKNPGMESPYDVRLRLEHEDLEMEIEEYSYSDSTINLGRIKEGEEKTVLYSLTAKTPGRKVLAAYLDLVAGQQALYQKKSEIGFEAIFPRLKARLKPEIKSIKIGDANKYFLIIENNEEKEAMRISVGIKTQNNYLIIMSIANEEGKEIDGNTVYLSRLAPGKRIEIPLSIIFGEKEEKKPQEAGVELDVRYEIEADQIYFSEIMDKQKVFSDFQFRSAAYYFSPQGDQLGVGPLPPVVGMPTSYWVVWEINDEEMNFSEIQISGVLKENVVWAEEMSVLSGSLDFFPENSSVLWRTETSTYAKCAFKVTLIPDITQVGESPVLVADIEYRTFDLFAEEMISGRESDISTNLKYDTAASNNSQVAEFNP